MREHPLLFGLFLALPTPQAAQLDAQLSTPTPHPIGPVARLRAIFLPVAMIVPPRRPEEDLFTALDLNGFQDSVRRAMAAMEQKGEPTAFFEREVARRADCFGKVCHVISTYESRHASSDEKPFGRGVNSIQLLNDGNRWWIASVMWDTERPANPIPPDYLPATIPPEYLRKN